jgi:thiosulfate/3-mercaptopyruvate sulfurtransferase
VEWSDAMTEDGRFRSTEELRALYAGLPEGDAAAYCQACVRGAHGVFALALAGRTARAYDGSMAEWANRDDTPLE